MSTLEEFEAAPVGATATHPAGAKAVKTFDEVCPWETSNCYGYSSDEMVSLGFTLDPAPAVSTTAREALWLAWNLAHPVKEGQVLPANTETISISDVSLHMTSEGWDKVVEPGLVGILRTLEPLPEPEPEWLEAPAVLASAEDEEPHVWVNTGYTGWRDEHGNVLPWGELMDVTPLYPKEDA